MIPATPTLDAAPAPKRNPWSWIPSLYFAEGIPYVMVMTVSVILYKNLNVSNTDIALYTSWLYLPWVIKPLWSPIVDLLGTKRRWVVVMQAALAVALAMVALTIPTHSFFQYTLAFFWLMAFSSATHDIAADGFYMLGLEQHEQAAFVGIRVTCYRIAMIVGEGALVVLAGYLGERAGGDMRYAWQVTMLIVAGTFAAATLYHGLILPRPASDQPSGHSRRGLALESLRVFADFFRKDRIIVILAFLLLYRLAEGQLVKLVYPFLLDDRVVGGLGLSTGDAGLIKGTVGMIALLAGGILGGVVVSRDGLKHWFWPMVLAIHLPDAVFIVLAYVQPESMRLIAVAVAVEQFGYGFGFVAYTLFMIMVSEGKHKTAHYAICTGIMALGMMLPGMISGWIQEQVGYELFFVWVLVTTIPAFIVAALVRIPPEFGRKSNA